MRVIITGGGTAGHVSPGIAIAEEIIKSDPKSEILFIGRENGNENRLIKKHGFSLKTISVHGLQRKLTLKNIQALSSAIKAKKTARNILRDFKPDAVIGTGGYVCWPVLHAAQKLNIKTFLHESNVTPGLTTRLLSKKCTTVFVGNPKTVPLLPKGVNCAVVGTPYIKSGSTTTRNEARQRLGLRNDDVFILSFGGSGGAKEFNRAIIDLITNVAQRNRCVHHLHASGERYFTEIKEDHPELTNEKGRCKIVPFIDGMEKIMPAADIVISRAGALTLAEISAVGIASILIPSPNVTGNHQYLNALEYESRGGAVIIEEKNLSNGELENTTLKLISSPNLRRTMAKKMKNKGQTDSAEAVFKIMKEKVE